MNFILNDRLAGSCCVVKSVLGENPKGFPTQRAALEEEYQLRWVGRVCSHALLLSFSLRLPGPSIACGPNRSLHAG